MPERSEVNPGALSWKSFVTGAMLVSLTALPPDSHFLIGTTENEQWPKQQC